ncbi:outer membrane protein assembly factor [Mucilaginibacter daejeonensis]|uniref:BamA/TamA family outer membrane protein n=1 Tax=Mucilaginibacter daejeonensis TaxID=398049 RepID=UPI001D1734C9|nr:BamA/TamA family outer membrane protein [Mucilaginibacter daejeonensis]UEG54962.1 outer membrane protein assembly factor [Mucilaginibacter daejeonensis]
MSTIRIYRLLGCCLFLFTSLAVRAQDEKSISLPQLLKGKKNVTDTVVTADTGRVPQKDLPDVFRSLFKIKASPEPDSVTSKPQFSLVPAVGYTLVSGLAAVLSGNIAYRNGPQARISTVVLSASYTFKKQFILPFHTYIWTHDNEYYFVGDYRFYKYPQSTFGLGSSSDIHAEDPMDFSFGRFYQTAYKHMVNNWYAGVGYNFDAYWGISHQGPLNKATSDYDAYGVMERGLSSGLTLNVLNDSRDNSINPSKGWYFETSYRNNLTALGSTVPWQSIIVDLRKYINFPASTKNVLALWSYNWAVLHGKPPYLSLPSNSWDPNSATGRGYIQGRFRGAQLFYLESEYRFNLTRNGLLGGVMFANAQSVSAQPGTRLQRVQPAFGPGLRVKLNKVSRTNISVDYGFGRQGSRGLFIDVGEVF